MYISVNFFFYQVPAVQIGDWEIKGQGEKNLYYHAGGYYWATIPKLLDSLLAEIHRLLNSGC